MKKLFSFVLLLGLVMSLSACGSESVTMQDVYAAHQLEAMLASHESVSVRTLEDGEVYMKNYMNAQLSYEEAGTWAMYMTDHSCYLRENGAYNRVVYIAPDGLVDMAGYRANKYASVALSPVSLEEEIQSVTKTDDRITVTSVMGKEKLAMLEESMTSCEFEYVLDAKTLSPIVAKSHYAYDDGTVFDADIEFEYDAPIPGDVLPFLELEQQTEDLRTVNIVFHSGTEKENTVTVQAPKGMVVGLTTPSGTIDEFEIYADAACTELYTSRDYISDTTIYIKWVE